MASLAPSSKIEPEPDSFLNLYLPRTFSRILRNQIPDVLFPEGMHGLLPKIGVTVLECSHPANL